MGFHIDCYSWVNLLNINKLNRIELLNYYLLIKC